jgi:hypothetical protein
MTIRQRLFLAASAALLFLPAPAAGCSIPVFRYALERWQPSSYELIVYHRGTLKDAERKELGRVRAAAAGANVEITEVDLDGKVDPEFAAVWKQHASETLPWVIGRFPDADLKSPLAWAGPLDSSKIEPLLDSPLRRQIVRDLFRGESAVFILLESGDAIQDAAAAKLLDDELPRLRKAIVLPTPTRDGPQVRSEIPVQVLFACRRLSRTNTEERCLIDLLTRCEDGLDKAKGPILFAVVGRGRVLTALHGKDLTAKQLEETARFLCGACSCQVKELNPGVDLLFTARWEAFLEIETLPAPRTLNR